MHYLIPFLAVVNNNAQYDLPDQISNNNSFLEMLNKIFSSIWQVLLGIVDAFCTMYNKIMELNSKLDSMIASAANGNINDLPIYQAIGTYRYLVGDTVFYFTYLMVLMGCCFTIYKIVSLIRAELSIQLDSGGISMLGKSFKK